MTDQEMSDLAAQAAKDEGYDATSINGQTPRDSLTTWAISYRGTVTTWCHHGAVTPAITEAAKSMAVARCKEIDASH